MASSKTPHVLCAGIGVQDILVRVPRFPQPGGKVMADGFRIVSGGCAVNAAIAVARLGGKASYSGPLGDEKDQVSNQLIGAMQHEGVETSGVVRVNGATAPVSEIMIDADGERMIATYRDRRIEVARPTNPDQLVTQATLMLADNRFAEFVQPVCEAARRANIRVVLDGDRPTDRKSPLFPLATHIVFSSECLRETTGTSDLGEGLRSIAPLTSAFLAVSNGADDILYLKDGRVQRMAVFKLKVVDTLAAGDVFHAGFALALAEGKDEFAAMRFGAAAAGLKCTRFGGSDGAPRRDEVEALLAQQP